ncbi:cell wall metabolism sensor histidine kinase WalK [Geminocystis sp. NIES-3709]|uniref:sensor histidine kinase n=1 Tax=Geminocystis sp. NIES-3709 TaxID=1617448 RepID=UPI0005FCB453|nr:HAMP domain-containing sensor histidine kinase [Geminocystis sp. NIES-3709]BAQ64356.1 histidine Kinase [Geminocystis sp. NIES-3709]
MKQPDSNRPFVLSPRFQSLRWQILGYSLAIMIGISAISIILVYQYFAHSLYQQVNERLKVLADSAAHSLEAIKKDKNALINPPIRRLDGDGDLDLSWQNLQQSGQSIEWFDQDQKFLGKSGKLNFSSPLILGEQTLSGKPPIQLLTITVYNNKHSQGQDINASETYIVGYIRVAESTEHIHANLQRLLWGFSIGNLLTLGLIGFGGIILTRQALKPLAKSYEQLQQFTGDASHELRSPLTAIKTSVEVLHSHPERIHPQDWEKLTNILSATEQMKHLVEDLLLLARTDNDLDFMAQDIVNIPLEDLLDDVLLSLEPQAEQKAINVKVHYFQSVIVQGNAFQLQRLFSNLLNNAIKYTPSEGQIKITLQQEEKKAIIQIEDSGIGISAEQLPFIFDRFWRAESARTPQIKGTGLGLAIAESIVQAHEGKITVKSQLNKGSCFTVYLPITTHFQE